ncbi:polysaccharide deacetylase family protein [Sebaldella sp. S0638]|uniref:polysaccharide deacetylase family protein n=1 Tax=Sebaldella sp. S0638 TaxID=2957809 RepID=UPI0020A02F17|nr:polysaccharide deacetylase family protein [Sebaldella sp. S0638]MCP1223120.1 polysaccharide deacetylase family protein [Sebaldella sp. S0638]
MVIVIIFFILLLTAMFFYQKGVPCIMYHHISIEKGVTPGEFEEHLKLIKKSNTFKMEEIENRNNILPKNSILVTFDDGYEDNYRYAFPLLKKYNVKATIFLNTAYIEKDPDYMSWDQIRKMYESGLVDFQLHTHSHFSVVSEIEVESFFCEKDKNKKELSREMKNIYRKEDTEDYPVFKKRGETAVKGYKITDEFIEKYEELLVEYKTLGREEKYGKLKSAVENELSEYIKKYSYEEYKKRVLKEILINKEEIEKKLAKKAEYLANPWGHKSKDLLEILKECGIKGMITTKKGTNSLKPDMYKIRRYETKTFKQFKFRLFICKNYLTGKIFELVS